MTHTEQKLRVKTTPDRQFYYKPQGAMWVAEGDWQGEGGRESLMPAILSTRK